MKTKQYIKLPGISNQKIRQKYYTPESIAHPAKANIPMMHWILKRFVQDGDVVLDPMAGIFTTGVEGMRLFPNSLFIGVELEDKFVKMARANIKKVERIAKKDMFLKIGKAVCVQGDARELEKILKEKVSKIITSPPFGQAQSGGGIAKKGYHGKHGSEGLRKGHMGSRSYMPKNIGDKENISNLPYGQADKIITSPPYASAGTKADENPENYIRREKERLKLYPMRPKTFVGRYSGNRNNIGNLKYGQANKIITSPPYSEIRMDGGGKDRAGMKPYTDEPTDTWRTQRDQKNLGNLKHGDIDKIISSPPYQEGIGHGGKRKKKAVERSEGIWTQGRDSYSKSKTNIGSLTGKTYLGEMLKVYQECFKILKSGGLMILILKDFIRGGKRIPLGEDTIKLCQAAGFEYLKTYYRKIEHPSFWRILQIQKYGESYRIDSEDILVFQK